MRRALPVVSHVLTASALSTLVAAAALIACGSFGSGDAPAAAPDGSITPSDASSVTDGTDATPTPDASPVDAARVCQSLVDEHFDGAFPPPGFANTSDNQSATSASAARAKSAPTSLKATVMTPATGGVGATLERSVPLAGGLAAAGRLELDYDVYLEPTTTAYVELGCTIDFRNATGGLARVLFARNPDGSLEVKSDSSFNAARPNAALAPSSVDWQHVHLVVESTGAATARAMLGVTPASASVAPPSLDLPMLADADHVVILCGIDFASREPADPAPVTVTTWVDDVVLRRCSP